MPKPDTSRQNGKLGGRRVGSRGQKSLAREAGQRKALEAEALQAEHVLYETATVAFSDLRGLFDEHGRLKPIQDLPEAIARSIASVEVVRENTRIHGESVVTEQVIKVKVWDKLRALELIAKLRAMFPAEKHEHSGPGGGPIPVMVSPSDASL